ncbi:unnamed protein product [Colletotrichum noveboracense]|uniref:Uncharacterized protein n=1 Tax=Colletotrichum noveboracense TaxID=2664923 RepID=A0A9W4WK70_9PEZI|nr:unnamed protein product [Colletotrichum noveboracense]
MALMCSRLATSRVTLILREVLNALLVMKGYITAALIALTSYLETAIKQEELAYRIEQVVSLNIRYISHIERIFTALICFFCAEHKSYIHLFRLIPLKVFPRVICAYSCLFELALGEMERRYVCGGERSLSLAHSEAVAVLDQLGRYAFTGHERHLPTTVLQPLSTLDSLQSGA